MKKMLLFLTVLLGSIVTTSVQAQQIGIIGSAVDGFVQDVKMFNLGSGNYTLLGYDLKVGTLRFNQDNTTPWGATAFPSGTAVSGSDDLISITQAGKYDISFSYPSGAYTLTIEGGAPVEPVVFANIGLIGSVVGGWEADIDMATTDGITYTLSNYALVAGEAKFRQDDAWTINWGASAVEGVAELNSQSNIVVAAGGNYDISFNIETLAYSFTLLGGPVDPVDPGVFANIGLIGSVVGGWEADIDMATTDGITYTLSNYALVAGEAKFRQDDAWTINWGASAVEGVAELNSQSNIVVAAGGNYDISFNIETLAYSFTLLGGPVDPVDPGVFANIGLIGSVVGGWEADIDMATTDGITYTLSNYALVAGEAKFRQDDAWTINWGASAVEGVAELNSQSNIVVAAGGNYDISFNIETLAYSFTLLGGPVDPVDPGVFANIGLIGSVVGGWEADIDMATTDGITYTLSNYALVAGEAKFRQDDAWTINWGASAVEGVAELNSQSNIVVAAGGNYDISFNIETLAYSFTLLGGPVDPVDPGVFANIGLIGSVVGGWEADIDMATTDGITYTLSNYALVAGEAKFRQDDAWTINWGASAVEGVAELNSQSNIVVAAGGNYDISFNIETLAYSFTLLGGPVDPVDPGVFANIGLIGSVVGGWEADIDMATTDGITYTLSNYALVAGEAKFRQDDAWTINWGASAVEGVAELNSQSNIVVAAGGNYDISFNIETLAYSFTLLGGPVDPVDPGVFANIGFIGTAIGGWDADVDMSTEDGVVYTLTTQLVVGEGKFRQDDDWAINWGPSAVEGIAELGNPANMNIAEAGEYLITFNLETLAYSIVRVDLNAASFGSDVTLSVYPNPTSDVINFSKVVDVLIYDMAGRLVINKSNVSQVNVTSLNKGTYLVVAGGKTFKIIVK
jgi:starch-binding outer membrane protein SusE/F